MVKNFCIQWWKNHKVKTLGLIAMMLTYLHQNFTQVAILFENHPKLYALCGYGFGALVTVFGFLVAAKDP
jgi:hypothetical protein